MSKSGTGESRIGNQVKIAQENAIDKSQRKQGTALELDC